MSPRILPFGPANLASPGDQKSRPNGFGAGRNRVTPLRRAQALRPVDISAGDARDFWAALVRQRCGSPEVCAVMFGVTVQTARNWFDAFSRPQLDAVLKALIWWPDEFAADRLPGGADMRRAA